MSCEESYGRNGTRGSKRTCTMLEIFSKGLVSILLELSWDWCLSNDEGMCFSVFTFMVREKNVDHIMCFVTGKKADDEVNKGDSIKEESIGRGAWGVFQDHLWRNVRRSGINEL